MSLTASKEIEAPAFSADPTIAGGNLQPADIQVNSNLAEDTVIGGVMDIAPGRNKVAMFANPFNSGFEEMLYVDERGHLLWAHAKPDSDEAADATNAGWSLDEVTQDVGEVVVLVHPTGYVYAFCTDTAGHATITAFVLVATKDSTGEIVFWQHYMLPDVPVASGSDVSLYTQYLTGRPAVPALFFVETSATQPPRMNFMAAVVPSSDSTDGWRYLGNSTFSAEDVAGLGAVGFDDASLAAVRWYSAAADGGLWRNWYTLSTRNLRRDKVDTGWSRVVGAWCMNFGGRPEDFGVGCVGIKDAPDGGRGPMLMTGYPYATTGIIGFQSNAHELDRTLTDVTIWQDAETRLHVYGRDAAGRLCVVHQLDWKTNPSTLAVEPVFDVHQSGNEPFRDILSTRALLAAVASYQIDAFPDDMPSQHVMHSGGAPGESCSIYTQQVGTSYWAREKIRIIPETFPAPYKVPRYLTTLSVVNSFGGPVAHARVTVTSDAAVDLEVAGRFYRTDVQTPVTLVTDGAGRVSLRVVARTLGMPMVHVTAPGLVRSVSVQLAGPVHKFMGGGGTLPNHADGFTAGTVSGAKNPDGSALFPGIRAQDSDAAWPPSAADLVTWCQGAFSVSSGAALPSALTTGLGAGQTIAAFSFQTHDSSRPGLQVFTSLDDLREVQAAVGDQGLLDAVSEWFGDIMQGIHDDVVSLAEVVVNVVDRTWTVLVELADGTRRWLRAAWDDVVSAAHAVESAFVAIGAKIGQVLDWLKWALDLKDIWDTKIAMNQAIREIPFHLSPVLELVEDYVDGWFASKEAEVATAFEAAKTAVSGRSFGALDTPGGLPAGTKTADQAAGMKDHVQSPHVAWLQDQMARPDAGAPLLASNAQAGLGDPFDALMVEVMASPAWADLLVVLTDGGKVFANLFNYKDPAALATAEVVTVLDLCEHLVKGLLELADSIVRALVDFVKAMLAEIPIILDTELAMGSLLSTLWTFIQEEAGVADPKPATIGDLALLLGAFPLTLLTKVAFGEAPFPGGVFPPWPGDDPQGVGEIRPFNRALGALQFAQGVTMAFDAGPDTLLNMDAIAPFEMPEMFWMGVALLHIVAYGVLDYPPVWGTPPLSKDMQSSDFLAYVSWACTIIVNGADMGCAFKNKWALAKWEDEAGQGAATYSMLGAIREVLSLCRYYLGGDFSAYGAWNMWINVTSFFSSFDGLIRWAYKQAPENLELFAAMGLKCVADPACDLFAGLSTAGQVLNEVYNPPRITVTQTNPPPAVIGTKYPLTQVAKGDGGFLPYDWSAVGPPTYDSLPAGMFLVPQPSAGETVYQDGCFLVGTPKGPAGKYAIALKLTDDYGPPGVALTGLDESSIINIEVRAS